MRSVRQQRRFQTCTYGDTCAPPLIINNMKRASFHSYTLKKYIAFIYFPRFAMEVPYQQLLKDKHSSRTIVPSPLHPHAETSDGKLVRNSHKTQIDTRHQALPQTRESNHKNRCSSLRLLSRVYDSTCAEFLTRKTERVLRYTPEEASQAAQDIASSFIMTDKHRQREHTFSSGGKYLPTPSNRIDVKRRK